jgi:hypothetical protein
MSRTHTNEIGVTATDPLTYTGREQRPIDEN